MFRALMQRKILVLGVAVIAAAALWYGMSQSSAPDTTIVTSSAAGTSNTPGGVVTPGPVDKDTQQILEILLALRAVKLDETLFSNQAFISLKDYSTQIVPEPVGRPDPFAPLGAAGQVSAAGTAGQSSGTPGGSQGLQQSQGSGN
jgi:hypothetical protein